jgi:hypothetical protein
VLAAGGAASSMIPSESAPLDATADVAIRYGSSSVFVAVVPADPAHVSHASGALTPSRAAVSTGPPDTAHTCAHATPLSRTASDSRRRSSCRSPAASGTSTAAARLSAIDFAADS